MQSSKYKQQMFLRIVAFSLLIVACLFVRFLLGTLSGTLLSDSHNDGLGFGVIANALSLLDSSSSPFVKSCGCEIFLGICEHGLPVTTNVIPSLLQLLELFTFVPKGIFAGGLTLVSTDTTFQQIFPVTMCGVSCREALKIDLHGPK